ncbi:reverse transcriptase domain-containing protein [Tanacetum coccineum]
MTLKCRNRRRSKQRVEPFSLEETSIVTMVDQRTMTELLQAPTEGYGDAIVILAILAENFELKHPLLNLGAARIWLEKEPPHSILTWEDLVSKFINQFLPPSKTTNLQNEITNFQQRFDESFCEEKFEKLNAMLRHVKTSPPETVKAISESCVTCGGPHPYYECLAADGNTFNASAAATTYNQNQGYRPQGDPNYRASNQMGPPGFPPVQNNQNRFNQNHGYNQNRGNNFNQGNQNYQAPPQVGPSNDLSNYMKTNDVNMRVMQNQISNMRMELKTQRWIYDEVGEQVQTQALIDELVVAPKPKPFFIPYPSRANKQKLREKDDNLASKFVEIFRELHFELSFADALLHMPKFASMFKSLLNNKEKLFDLAKTPVNENCSAVILKKLPKKLGDPGKFLIPCDFPEIVECLALADLGASINLMPLSIWKKLSLPNYSYSNDFLNLKIPSRLLVHPVLPKIINSPVDDEAITFKVGQTSRYSYNDAESVNRIDVIDVSCEEYAQEVLGFSDSSTSGNPTPSLDPILSTSFPSLTPFEGGDFILEEIEACLTNDSISRELMMPTSLIQREDLLLLEKLLYNDPSSPLPLKELHFEEIKMIKSSIDDPPELELKDLPSHLEYAFLEGTNKLPVIISKELKDEEKAALLKVLKSHKRAIAWKISDIKGIDPSFCTHKILMEDDFKPAIQHQIRVNPKIHKVIKKEVIKLLDAGLIYPISDSLWVRPVHCVPKKGGMTLVKNEDKVNSY